MFRLVKLGASLFLGCSLACVAYSDDSDFDLHKAFEAFCKTSPSDACCKHPDNSCLVQFERNELGLGPPTGEESIGTGGLAAGIDVEQLRLRKLNELRRDEELEKTMNLTCATGPIKEYGVASPSVERLPSQANNWLLQIVNIQYVFDDIYKYFMGSSWDSEDCTTSE